MSKDFTIVFEKVQEVQGKPLSGSGQAVDALLIPSDTLREMDEISELRRLVAEITEPEPMSYTMT